MFDYIRRQFKTKEQLIQEELSRPDFVETYLMSDDQGKLFQTRCKIPKSNIFRKKQFQSWCDYMVTFTAIQKIYKELVKTLNDQQKIDLYVQASKKDIYDVAIKVIE